MYHSNRKLFSSISFCLLLLTGSGCDLGDEVLAESSGIQLKIANLTLAEHASGCGLTGVDGKPLLFHDTLIPDTITLADLDYCDLGRESIASTKRQSRDSLETTQCEPAEQAADDFGGGDMDAAIEYISARRAQPGADVLLMVLNNCRTEATRQAIVDQVVADQHRSIYSVGRFERNGKYCIGYIEKLALGTISYGFDLKAYGDCSFNSNEVARDYFHPVHRPNSSYPGDYYLSVLGYDGELPLTFDYKGSQYPFRTNNPPAVASTLPVDQTACLTEGSAASLSGLVTLKQFNGSSSLRTAYVLTLEEPVCVMVDQGGERTGEVMPEKVKRFQLVRLDRTPLGINLEQSTSMRVNITGDIMVGNYSQYYIEPNAIDVKSVTPVAHGPAVSSNTQAPAIVGNWNCTTTEPGGKQTKDQYRFDVSGQFTSVGGDTHVGGKYKQTGKELELRFLSIVRANKKKSVDVTTSALIESRDGSRLNFSSVDASSGLKRQIHCNLQTPPPAPKVRSRVVSEPVIQAAKPADWIASYAEQLARQIEKGYHPACAAVAGHIRNAGHSSASVASRERLVNSLVDRAPDRCF